MLDEGYVHYQRVGWSHEKVSHCVLFLAGCYSIMFTHLARRVLSVALKGNLVVSGSSDHTVR